MKKQDFVKVMNDVIGPDWQEGNHQAGEIILDHFEKLFPKEIALQMVNQKEFIEFLIKSLQMIKQELN